MFLTDLVFTQSCNLIACIFPYVCSSNDCNLLPGPFVVV